jgi:hypothetical protein
MMQKFFSLVAAVTLGACAMPLVLLLRVSARLYRDAFC